ncbi:MAG: hypothetical protein ACI3VM_02220 [Oscillospiraceae bacterium]
MKRRILSMLLVLMMLLTIMPTAAFAEETAVSLTEGVQGTYTKAEGSTEKVTFTFTPKKTGVYIFSFAEPMPSNDEMDITITSQDIKDEEGNEICLLRTSSGVGNVYKFTYEIEAENTYNITFDNSKAGDYLMTVSYVEPMESVEINDTNFPDVSFREWVTKRDWHSESGSYKADGKLDTYEIASVFQMYTPSEIISKEYGLTCTEEGYTGRVYCTRCEMIVAGEVQSALGHNYGDDNRCTRCGQENPGHTHDFLHGTVGTDDNGTYLTCAVKDCTARSYARVETGKCGDNVTYTWTKFDVPGFDTLVISGKGDMWDWGEVSPGGVAG